MCGGPAALLLSTATPLAVANLPTRATSSTPGLRTLSGPGAAPGPGWEDKEGPRAGSESRGRRSRFRTAPCSPPARRACPSAGTRGAGGRALAGGGPAGPRASPGTRPCHSHDAQPPGTASGARPPPPPPRVGGGRDGPGGRGVAPPLATPAPPSSPALPRRAGSPSPRGTPRWLRVRDRERAGRECSRFPALRARRLPGRGAQGGQLGRLRGAGRGVEGSDRVGGWG